MSNDITALMATMKAAAEKATPGRIGDRIDGSGSIKYQCFGNDGSLVLQTDHKNMEYGFIGPNDNADEFFFRMCTPENVKALVEALEAKQPHHNGMMQLSNELVMAKQRIAELESRTVTVKLPDYRSTYKEPFALEIEHHVRKALNDLASSAGIQVIEGDTPQGV